MGAAAGARARARAAIHGITTPCRYPAGGYCENSVRDMDWCSCKLGVVSLARAGMRASRSDMRGKPGL